MSEKPLISLQAEPTYVRPPLGSCETVETDDPFTRACPDCGWPESTYGQREDESCGWDCTGCGHQETVVEAPPLVLGGQGRSPERVARDGFNLYVAFLLAFLAGFVFAVAVFCGSGV